MKKINIFAGIDMSEEGIKKRYEDLYNRAKTNPENMSYWFPKIESSLSSKNSILKLPKTKIISLDMDTWKWLRSDRYTPEKIQEFNELLVQELDDFLKEDTLFMKTGIFSNKFIFSTTNVNDRETIGQQFLNIFYDSMIVGADNTNEVVFREMVKDTENRLTIYDGMPLHTEFRVFFDFDTKKVIGIANYWHPEVMESHLNEKDLPHYLNEKETIVNDFNHYKSLVISEVEKYLGGVTGLNGKWSVDVMKNGEDFWLIDMARMEKSALVKQMEQI